MTLAELLIKRKKLIRQIEKLEELYDICQNQTYDYNTVLEDSIWAATTLTLPFATLSLYGLQVINDQENHKSLPLKLALGVPCVVLGAALTVPVVAPVAVLSATAEGVRTSRALINNKRADKIPEAINNLKKEKAEIEKEIKLQVKNKKSR